MDISGFLNNIWQQPSIEGQQELIAQHLHIEVQAVGVLPSTPSNGALLHHGQGVWCVCPAKHAVAAKLAAIAPYEEHKDWWVALLIDGSALSDTELRVARGSVRSLSNAELSLLRVHVCAYQDSMRIADLMEAAKKTQALKPAWSLGACMFSVLPGFVKAQIIDTDLSMQGINDEQEVMARLSKIAARFSLS